MRARLSLLTASLAALLLATPACAIVGASSDGAALGPSLLMVLNRQGAAAGFCSGTVVRQDVVLTAAHCVPDGAALKVHYREGAEIRLLGIAAITRSPQFRADAITSRKRSVDLALIHLDKPLPGGFRPAVLGDQGAVGIGGRFRLAGFGVQREGDAGTSGNLRVADIVVEAPLSPVLLWGRGAAGSGGACMGDSGGPVLAADDTVVAVIAWSAGSGSHRCGSLTQAVWIAPQRAWIDSVLRSWGAGPLIGRAAI